MHSGWTFSLKTTSRSLSRLRENMHPCTEDGCLRQFRTLLRKHRNGAWTGWLGAMVREPENRRRLAARRIEGGEALIVADEY